MVGLLLRESLNLSCLDLSRLPEVGVLAFVGNPLGVLLLGVLYCLYTGGAKWILVAA